MKIISPAKDRPNFFLFANDLTCPECEATFRPQLGDHFARLQPAGKRQGVWLPCPVCQVGLNVWDGKPPSVTLR